MSKNQVESSSVFYRTALSQNSVELVPETDRTATTITKILKPDISVYIFVHLRERRFQDSM
ncbi:hypothetical protein GcC1_140014 [Golovinomyces cichoracearum]|uniref:Uncharacterized protein n=1 Tax=Golovinomyces cichoracearum TaxID=62708 RepID=A0A420I0K1_9PEZI|nr:hypothetical protein GcC1_140014 [Golovinomyces cichoracearum]